MRIRPPIASPLVIALSAVCACADDTWNADGTPNFGEPLALGTDIAVPSGE